MSKAFCFLDIETTGLDPREDQILEVAYAFTNEHFQILNSQSFLVEQDNWDTTWRKLNDNKVVYDMHTKSGLLASLSNDDTEKTTLDDIYHALEDDLSKATLFGPAHLSGRSIHFDKSFLLAFDFDMLFDDSQRISFHHRMLDLSAVKMMLELSGLDPKPFEAVNPNPHRAICDVMADVQYAQNLSSHLKGVFA